MFEFLFKRPGDKPDETPGGQAGQPDQAAPAAGAQRALQAEKVKELAGDEAAAAEFVLHSEFSELRLAAAEFIHSPAQLERVHAAIRNTDRRVAKLLQSRLDAIRHHQAELQRGQACIEQARQLLGEEKLTPNHVAELDRKWSVIAAPELVQEFDAARAALSQRLETQVLLQRAMIDSLSELRKLEKSGMPAAELAARLEQMAATHAAALLAPEHASLPRNLINEFATVHGRVSGSLAALELSQAALAAREAALAEWESAPPSELSADTVRKAWRQLAAAPEGEAAAALQQRCEALLATLPPPLQPLREERRAKETRPAAQAPDQHFLDMLEAMEAALQQGSLGTAAELDKMLKDVKGIRLSPAQSERIAHARGELKRLSDWARWGGNVSREELIKAVEQLPAQKLAMSELAKKVGSMRDRWKALDTLSGAAPKSLWERFDTACTAAYAPAAAHFKHLADERHINAAKAQALIDEAAAETAKLGADDGVDWKHMATTVQRLRLGWSHLGAIDRKEKKRLDQEFGAALTILQGPLEEQRKGEVAQREALIEQALALNPQDRHALDTLRALQERWQEHARALPLERKAEQALWQRFRAACDAVFSKRKESAHAADAERRAHQTAKEAICVRLETAAADIDAAGAARLLREAASEWHAIGAVPRANEAKLEKRYHAAIAGIQHTLDAAKRSAGLAQASALRDKLRLCQALEEAVVATDVPDSADWNARWSALPALSADYERALQARFAAALAALAAPAAGRDAYARLLEQNRPMLQQEILRLEIAAGVDSGSEFARERLKLQVEVLQSSLKSGQKPVTQAAQLLQLCAMPALVDARTASRIEHLFARTAREAR
ncbi:MAG TPA: DUF349 domain-containing protein [Telluria sp.]|nr:DUF349 domain-containing protein [Telluria sp.]